VEPNPALQNISKILNFPNLSFVLTLKKHGRSSMADERARRKLSGILSADAVGYSRLMQEDEASTIRDLEDNKRLMGELIQQFKGRVVDAPGDNLLAEFDSVVDATECAVEIQQELKGKNSELPDNRKMQFRMGVNLGDVVEEADRIYGDGVNIAARLEGLAESGGICISRTAYDHVKNKLELGYEYLGEHNVKNIAEPVRVYRVLMEPEAAGKVIGEKRFIGRVSRKTAIAAIIGLIIVAGGLMGWNIYLHQSKRIEPASTDKMSYPLPDKPSIAVLPFDNLTGDPDMQYISDGLSEEIISGLSQVPELFVIARNSSFIYRGKPVKVQQVSEELGVRYVLEGSLRKGDSRLRITAQLIDAVGGYHIWSERYDRELKDILEMQDDIMRNVLINTRVKLTEGEQLKSSQKIDFKAMKKFWQARWNFYRMNPEGFAMAQQLVKEAIEIEPNFAGAYPLLSFIYLVGMGTSKSPLESMALAEKYAQKSLQLDSSQPWPHIVLGQISIYKRQYDKAITEGRKAITLSPNGADSLNALGFFLHMAEKWEEAIPLYERAIRLNPYPPSFYYTRLGGAYADVGRYDESIDSCKMGLKRQPNDPYARLVSAGVYIWQGREKEAQAEIAEILRKNPNYSLKRGVWPRFYKNKDTANRWIKALQKAGLQS
jgi:adenylate cyclase